MLISVAVAPLNVTAVSLGVTVAIIAAILVPVAFYFYKKYLHGKGKRSARVEAITENPSYNNNRSGGRQNPVFEHDNEPIRTNLNRNDSLSNSPNSTKQARTSIPATRVDPNINTLISYHNNDAYFNASALPTGSKSELVGGSMQASATFNPSIATIEKFSPHTDRFNRNKKNCVVPALPYGNGSRFSSRRA